MVDISWQLHSLPIYMTAMLWLHPQAHVWNLLKFKIESSLIQYILTSVSPLSTSPSSNPSYQIHSSFVSFSEKQKQKPQTLTPRDNNQTWTKWYTIKQSKIPNIKAGQGNPVGRKVSQEQAKESEMHLLPPLRVLQKHHVTAITYTQRTWYRSMQVPHYLFSLCEPMWALLSILHVLLTFWLLQSLFPLSWVPWALKGGIQ